MSSAAAAPSHLQQQPYAHSYGVNSQLGNQQPDQLQHTYHPPAAIIDGERLQYPPLTQSRSSATAADSNQQQQSHYHNSETQSLINNGYRPPRSDSNSSSGMIATVRTHRLSSAAAVTFPSAAATDPPMHDLLEQQQAAVRAWSLRVKICFAAQMVSTSECSNSSGGGSISRESVSAYEY